MPKKTTFKGTMLPAFKKENDTQNPNVKQSASQNSMQNNDVETDTHKNVTTTRI
jgi:hypothetical protein